MTTQTIAETTTDKTSLADSKQMEDINIFSLRYISRDELEDIVCFLTGYLSTEKLGPGAIDYLQRHGLRFKEAKLSKENE